MNNKNKQKTNNSGNVEKWIQVGNINGNVFVNNYGGQQVGSRTTNSERTAKSKYKVELQLLESLIKPINSSFAIVATCIAAFIFGILLLVIISGEWLFVPFMLFVSLGITFISYCIFFSNAYAKARRARFYDSLTLDERFSLKHSFQQKNWGSLVVDMYMFWAVEILLIPNKREAEKVMKFLKKFWLFL